MRSPPCRRLRWWQRAAAATSPRGLLPLPGAEHQRQRRDPAVHEAVLGHAHHIERVLQRAGYFKTGLRKIEAARTVAAHMEPSRNTSPSFGALRASLANMVQP